MTTGNTAISAFSSQPTQASSPITKLEVQMLHATDRCAAALGIETVPAVIVEMSDVEANDYRHSLVHEKRLQRIFGVSLDQPMDALLSIAEMMEREQALSVEIDELDRIADGIELEDDSILVVKEYWFDSFLTSLKWWLWVSNALLESTNVDPSDFQPKPAFAHHREAILKLMNDIFTSYVPAHQEGYLFSSDWMKKGEATRELLKRYRTFTRYICTFAQEVWPDVSMDPLLKRA
jgi:hypothetical protein